MDLEKVMREELAKKGIADNVQISIQPYSNFVPDSVNHRDSLQISVAIDSDYDIELNYLFTMNLRFLYDSENKLIEGITIDVPVKLKGQGYGRKLLEAQESFGKRLGCTKSISNCVFNEFFLIHMGYYVHGEFAEKEL